MDGDYVVIEKEYINSMDLLKRVESPEIILDVTKYSKSDIKKELKDLGWSKKALYDGTNFNDDSEFEHYYLEIENLDEQTEFFESLLAYFN